MFKYCVLFGDKLSINNHFYTPKKLNFNELFKSVRFYKVFEQFSHRLINIKFSINQSVFKVLSTVSTQPITKPTLLKINEIYN